MATDNMATEMDGPSSKACTAKSSLPAEVSVDTSSCSVSGGGSSPSCCAESQCPHEEEDSHEFPVPLLPEHISVDKLAAHAQTPREALLKRLSEALLRKSLTKVSLLVGLGIGYFWFLTFCFHFLQINLSQRGLGPSDARLISMALTQNEKLVSLKLGYNNLGDDGLKNLARGIAQHSNLESLDLGFNCIGDEGCRSLNEELSSFGYKSRLCTLYLAGNHIGEAGAADLGHIIKQGSLRKVYLSGNDLGPDGVKVIADSVLEVEYQDSRTTKGLTTSRGVQELFLGGTGMGLVGCNAVARLLAGSSRLKKLSLANSDIGNSQLAILASSILSNKDSLPLESLQLSFNRISSPGIESLMKALWDTPILRELCLDNNLICDSGVKLIAAVLPKMKRLETLNLGFNRFKAPGILALMKVIPSVEVLSDVSICGNTVDTEAAKGIACALAYDNTIRSIALVHCNITHEAQRHIVAGIVSNQLIKLKRLSGFCLGPIVVTLGFPEPIGQWSNDQVIDFVHKMWGNFGASYDNEAATDPLSIFQGKCSQPAPLDAAVVVEAAKKAYGDLVATGSEVPVVPVEDVSSCPLEENCLVEADSKNSEVGLSSSRAKSFVAPPESSASCDSEDKERKRLCTNWLDSNRDQLKKLAQQAFSPKELWALHQHYFSPVVNECGGDIQSPSLGHTNSLASCPNEPARPRPPASGTFGDSYGEGSFVPGSDASVKSAPKAEVSSLPVLKRKVSYRFLGDAALNSAPMISDSTPRPNSTKSFPDDSVSMLIENGHSGHTLPRKTKRARRNRARISFLPRIKNMLDSSLDICHEKSLATMRQLFYLEKALLEGQIDPAIKPGSRAHLSGELAASAEMIMVDMLELEKKGVWLIRKL